MSTDEMVGRVVLGRYRIINPLARGGMGVVYLGRTEGAAGFSRPVVVKRILPHLLSDPEMAKMFVREARILSNLHHPGIVGVIDFGEEESAYVMVLEYVHGYDVGMWRKYLEKRGREMSMDVALHIVIHVLDALHYAHTLKRPDGTLLKIIHRDISPGNILLDVEGHIRLLDFGIARIDNEAGEYRTQEGTFKGKLAYAPPELLKGKEPSAQSDMYSCAVVLYQLLTGTNPFRGNTTPETLTRVMTHTAEPISELLPDTPPMLDVVLGKALSKNPAVRYSSAAEFADALRELSNAPENEVAASMVAAIQRDFNGKLPELMSVEPLHLRDAAWREAVNDVISVHPLRSSRPSPAPLSPAAYGAPLSEEPTQLRSSTDEFTDLGAKGNKTLPIAIGALAIAVLGVAAVLLFRPQPASSETPRYLVVSKDEQPQSATTAPPVPDANDDPASGVPTEDDDATAPSASALTPTKATTPKSVGVASTAPIGGGRVEPDPRKLTQTFSRRQGLVQGCFKTNREQALRTPSLQISFSVNDAGRVTGASLLPASLGGTPLGQCILGVARGTRFGSLTEGVSFRIPVRARKLE